MNGAADGEGTTQGPPSLPNEGESKTKEVEIAETADNLESMAITEEDPSNQPEVNENVADAAAPTPELPQLRPACKQVASGAFIYEGESEKGRV